jgi:hypothetical protein
MMTQQAEKCSLFRPTFLCTTVLSIYIYICKPILLAALSKAWGCDCSLAGIAGSNSDGGVYVCLSVVCCQVEVSVWA